MPIFSGLARSARTQQAKIEYDRSVEKAKEIYPTMQSPTIMIKQIKELIRQQLI